ncbi:hypothetical protein [Amycolatopsis circi]|uniref:hypothetical protein n=1 Tax=Amycolatopsis circi TaxID=871959 RepID=UPI001ABFFA34|nr:hypothetical protein [Amycolatopsis circi]
MGPQIPGLRRPLLGFFAPVLGYAAPRVRLLYLDEDPVEVAERERHWEPAPRPEAERVLLSGPVRTIVPWQDW